MTGEARPQYDFRGKYTQGGLARRMVEGYFQALGELLAGLDAASALEVGCGEGFSTQRIRRMLPVGASFEAGDVEDRLVQAARAANPDVPIRLESIYQLPRPDRSADLVLALEVLEHLQEPAKALAEVCRVSRKYVVLGVPREPLWRAMNLARLKYLGSLGNTPGHLQHWSGRAFERFVGSFCEVRAVRRPIPWTMILARVR
jgi:SAM-dependent methyltransferase